MSKEIEADAKIKIKVSDKDDRYCSEGTGDSCRFLIEGSYDALCGFFNEYLYDDKWHRNKGFSDSYERCGGCLKMTGKI
jgi:hypothetical protein